MQIFFSNNPTAKNVYVLQAASKKFHCFEVKGALLRSTSVSLRFDHFLFFLFNVIFLQLSVKYHCFHCILCVISSVTRFILVTLSSGYSAAALDEEYVFL